MKVDIFRFPLDRKVAKHVKKSANTAAQKPSKNDHVTWFAYS